MPRDARAALAAPIAAPYLENGLCARQTGVRFDRKRAAGEMAAAGRRIQDIPLDEITWADLEALCENGVEEGPTLEFKSGAIARPHNGETERQMRERVGLEIAEAICAFANTEGGTIILGIADKDDVAESVAPIDALSTNAMSFEDRAKDAVDPRPYTVRFRSIPDPADETRGALVIRVGASQLAPHGAKLKVEKDRKKIDAPVAFIRDGTGNKVMTMRDLQSSFWDARTRREKVEAQRLKQDVWLDGLNETYDRSLRGILFRCTAIIQNFPLGASGEVIRRRQLPDLFAELRDDDKLSMHLSPNCVRAFPSASGWTLPVRAPYIVWTIENSGLVSVGGFAQALSETENLQDPRRFVRSAMMAVAVAHRLRRSYACAEAAIELDVRFLRCASAKVSSQDYDMPRHYSVRAESHIGPYLLTDLDQFEQTLKSVEERIWAAFAVERDEVISEIPRSLADQLRI